MESFPEMTSKVTALVCATGIGDPGRVSDAGAERPDPEVPERARRRRFTAKYASPSRLPARLRVANGRRAAAVLRVEAGRFVPL